MLCWGVGLAAAGCTAAQAEPASAPTSLPACQAPEPAVLPDAAGSLSETDTGAYCLAAGQVLDVFLTAPAGSAKGVRWGHITVADSGVLRYGNSGVLTPPVNVTAEVFVAAGRGATKLTSALPGGKVWSATVVVK
jgi:hypothetical protein